MNSCWARLWARGLRTRVCVGDDAKYLEPGGEPVQGFEGRPGAREEPVVFNTDHLLDGLGVGPGVAQRVVPRCVEQTQLSRKLLFELLPVDAAAALELGLLELVEGGPPSHGSLGLDAAAG